MSSLSPSVSSIKEIEKTLKDKIQVQNLPLGLLIYGFALKKSDSGISENPRILFIDEARKVLGYCDEFPKQLPLSSADKLKIKVDTNITTCQVRIPKGESKHIEIECYANPKASKKSSKIEHTTWTFIMKTADLAKEWVDLITKTKVNIRKKEEDRQANSVLVTPNINQPSGLVRNTTTIAPQSFQAPKNDLLGDSLPINSIFPRKTDPFSPDPIRITDSQYVPPPPSQIVPPPQSQSRISVNDPRKNNESIEPGLPNESTFGKIPSRLSQKPEQFEYPSVIPGPGPGRVSESIVSPNKPPSNAEPNRKPASGSVILPNQHKPISTPGFVVFPNQSEPNQKPASESVTLPNQPKPISNPGSVVDPKKSEPGSQPRPGPNPPPPANTSDWNRKFNSSVQPVKVLQDFQKHAEDAVKGIISELVMEKSLRRVQPVSVSDGLWTFDHNNLQISMTFINQSENVTRLVKNQFRNYDYILGSMKRKGPLRVPLSCIVDYKGTVSFVKAKVQNFEEARPGDVDNELNQLERVSKVSKDIFFKSQNVSFKRCRIQNPSDNTREVVYIDNLTHFLPSDVYADKQFSQLRAQTVEVLDKPVSSIPQNKGMKRAEQPRNYQSLEAAAQTMRAYSEQVLVLLEKMDIIVLNSKELITNLHLNGVNIRCLGDMYKRAQLPIIRKYLLSEMVSRVCCKMVRSKLQTAIKDASLDRSSKHNEAQADISILDSVFQLLNDIVSGNPQSDKLWKNIATEVKRNYQVSSFTKEDLSVGYFLSSFFQKSNLRFDYDLLSKEKQYFRTSNILKREFLLGFGTKCHSYSIAFAPQIQQLQKVLNDKPNVEGFNALIQSNRLNAEPIPEFYDQYGYDERIRVYLSSFIDQTGTYRKSTNDSALPRDFKHLHLYSTLFIEPPTLRSIKLSIKCVQWELNYKREKEAQELLDATTILVSFWGNQYHPLLSELYDLFTAAYNSFGELDKAAEFAKTSIANAAKVAGSNSALAAEKYYSYGDVCFKAGKKADALNSYAKTRQINQANDLANGKEHANLCLKMAVLYLNMGKYSESIARTLECLKIAQKIENNEKQLINSFETLARIYQITEQKNELMTNSQLSAKRLKNAESPQTIERNLKIVISPHLKNLSSGTTKQFVDLIEALKSRRGPRDTDWKEKAWRAYDTKNNQDNFALNFCQKLQKLDKHLADINSRNLLSSYTGPEMRTNSEAEEFLADLDIVCCIVADRFMLGVLTENT